MTSAHVPFARNGGALCRSVNDAAIAADATWNAEVSAFLEQRFAGFVDIAVPAFAVGYFLFFAIGGFLHVSSMFRPLEKIMIYHSQSRSRSK